MKLATKAFAYSIMAHTTVLIHTYYATITQGYFDTIIYRTQTYSN